MEDQKQCKERDRNQTTEDRRAATRLPRGSRPLPDYILQVRIARRKSAAKLPRMIEMRKETVESEILREKTKARRLTTCDQVCIRLVTFCVDDYTLYSFTLHAKFTLQNITPKCQQVLMLP